MWLQLLKATEVASYKSANESADQAQAPTDEAGDELWYSSAGICLVLLVEPLVAPFVPLLLLASALPMLKRAHRSLSEDGKLNVDVLDASATSLLVVQGAFPMAIFMVWLINVADWIRDLTMMRSKKAIEEILGFQNIEAWVVRDGQKIRVSVAEVQLGETVVVYPGERIAVDGTVLSGKALVDQAALTGESVPVEKEEGALVYAATVVREGKLYICAERIGSATEAAQILRLVEAAPARETKIQNYAVKWANDLVPYSFVGGAIGAVMGGGLPGAAAVLVVDYGTGIRIAAPTTVLSAMTKAIRNGILIKGGRALESLAEVDAVVFDKTGTLTTGHPDVLDVVPVNSSTAEEVLALAAAAELRLTHPVADAIVRAAEARQLSIPERTASDYSLGLGVEAIVNDSVVLVGSPRFMTLRGSDLVAGGPGTDLEDTATGDFSALRGKGRACHRIAVYLRPGAARGAGSCPGIERSGNQAHRDDYRRSQGCRQEDRRGTRDHRVPGRSVSWRQIRGGPASAARRLQGRRRRRRGQRLSDAGLCRCGHCRRGRDGGGRETAPVVLLHGGLWKVPLAIDIGRETVALIRQNWNIIAIPNTFAAALACIGLLGPIGATLLSNGSAIVATLNGLRPIMEQQPIKVVSQAHGQHKTPACAPCRKGHSRGMTRSRTWLRMI